MQVGSPGLGWWSPSLTLLLSLSCGPRSDSPKWNASHAGDVSHSILLSKQSSQITARHYLPLIGQNPVIRSHLDGAATNPYNLEDGGRDVREAAGNQFLPWTPEQGAYLSGGVLTVLGNLRALGCCPP